MDEDPGGLGWWRPVLLVKGGVVRRERASWYVTAEYLACCGWLLVEEVVWIRAWCCSGREKVERARGWHFAGKRIGQNRPILSPAHLKSQIQGVLFVHISLFKDVYMQSNLLFYAFSSQSSCLALLR